MRWGLRSEAGGSAKAAFECGCRFKGAKDENVAGGGGANTFKLEIQRAVTSTSDLQTEATNQRRNVGRQKVLNSHSEAELARTRA